MEQLSQGALMAIFTDPLDMAKTEHPLPVLQCIHIKQMPAQGTAPERFRIIASDGLLYTNCMLGVQVNRFCLGGQLQKHSLFRVKAYQSNIVKNKRVLIVLDLDPIETLSERLGDPQSIDDKLAELPAPETTTTAATAKTATIGGTAFYGASAEKKPVVKQQPPSTGYSARGGGGGGGGSGGSHGNANISMISGISPYSNRWTVKARVTNKSDIRTWHKSSGEGKLFSVNLLDETGEIRATGFNEQCDQFYHLLNEGSVYYISTPIKCSPAKKPYNTLPHDFELTFEAGTVIEKAEDQTNVPHVRFSFHSIQDLAKVEKDETVDVIGVLKEVHDVQSITSKTSSNTYDKRDLTIIDSSMFSIRLTVWGKIATSFNVQPDSIIAFKGVKVSDYGGRSLSLLSSGTMVVNPEIDDAFRLRGWYDDTGRADSFSNHNTAGAGLGGATGRQEVSKTVTQVKDELLGAEKEDYFSVLATIMHVKTNPFSYPACRSKDCGKKVTIVADDLWRCEKCDITHDRPEYRYMLSACVADHTGDLWVSCFDDAGRLVMGTSADELVDTDINSQLAAFEAACLKRYSFRIRAKMDNYGENPRIRYQVVGISPVNFVAEARKLVEKIKEFHIGS